jgi:DNA polymerase-3 subunit gamma/tau
MAAQALYLKYRPQTFEEVAGQEPITRTLRNALRQGKIRHAYLLTGPRGTGKTTTARLLAKAVNCDAPEEERPCNACSICVAINEGRLLDLIEIDAASNRGIDEIRDIREKVGFRPSQGQYKVYVLDEAHMLTEPAFNALLKTLEEPPPHAIFTLVTTDPHKIPATIASRCQRFDFRRIPLQVIVDRLAYIAAQEGVTVEPAALELIAHHGTGAMRDAISLLDQLTSYGDEITLAQVQMVLGTLSSESAAKLVVHLADGDVAGGLDLINRTVDDGADPRQFGREVVEYLRGLLLVREGAGARLLNATAEQAAEMEALAERMTAVQLLRVLGLFNQAVTDLKRGLQTIPQLPLEMALVESVLEPEAAQTLASPDDPAPLSSPQPVPEGQQVAEQTSGAQSGTRAVTPAVTPASRVERSIKEEPVPTLQSPAPAQTQGGGLTLAQVEQTWSQVLQAVRQRNPAAEGALRSGCKPVEVRGEEVVVTFPYAFLRDKLGDPQRRTEIQDALTEVLHVDCQLKLVLASEYVPHQQADPAPPPAPAEPAGEDAETGDEQVPEAISRWAAEHGGEVKFVPS